MLEVFRRWLRLRRRGSAREWEIVVVGRSLGLVLGVGGGGGRLGRELLGIFGVVSLPF